MTTTPSGKLSVKQNASRNKTLKFVDDVHGSCYKHNITEQQGKAENMGKEPNFDLGGKPLKLDSGLTLDPRIVRLVQALARYSAEQDFKAQIEK